MPFVFNGVYDLSTLHILVHEKLCFNKFNSKVICCYVFDLTFKGFICRRIQLNYFFLVLQKLSVRQKSILNESGHLKCFSYDFRSLNL